MAVTPTRSVPFIAAAVVLTLRLGMAWAASDGLARAAVETDWLKQLAVAEQDASAGNVATHEDAAGGADGVINGSYGFHCASGGKDSWWQVDLGREAELDRVVVYNRCGGAARRAAKGLIMLASSDGRAWQRIYTHDGAVFYGHTDNKPLVVSFRGKGLRTRFVRIQRLGSVSFHLDEVQVYPADDSSKNIALGQPADQNSTSRWSTCKLRPATEIKLFTTDAVRRVLAHGRRLAERFEAGDASARLAALAARVDREAGDLRQLYMDARWAVREIVLSNPMLDFGSLVFVKRHPGTLAHMCDQYYGCYARQGGGLYAIEDIGRGFRVRDLVAGQLPAGSFLNPDVSFDGRQIAFAYSRATGVEGRRWGWTPEVCYHVFTINVDGSGLRQLTTGPYDDFDPRFLPGGDIVFVSTRRGGYCRCGGRPVPTYTLYRMGRDGSHMSRLSCHETNEWHPFVTNDGMLVYTRWDYVDRHTNLAHSLWVARLDGSNALALYGNYNFARKPWGLWHPRAIPDSRKIMAIAGAHHGYAEGSVVLIDPAKARDGLESLTRLTPDVAFPEAEGWPVRNYTTPWPLSEEFYLVAYSPDWSAKKRRTNSVMPGIYLMDRWGHRELLHRDPAIPCESPVPVRPRPRPTASHSTAKWSDGTTGRFVLSNVYASTEPMDDVRVAALRVVQVLPKSTHRADHPRISRARQISVRHLLGTVPVEADGSAYFTAPAGVPLYFQAVDSEGMAYQGMRSITYVQPGETLSCVGCHEPRHQAPPNRLPLAVRRPPSSLEPGPDGTRPLSYLRLVQPVLDRHCVRCHSGPNAKKGVRLTGALGKRERDHCESYRALATRKLVHWFDSVNGGEWKPRTYPGKFGARASKLVEMLRKGHSEVKLAPEELGRIYTWIDLNVPFYGAYEPEHIAAQRRGEAPPVTAMMR